MKLYYKFSDCNPKECLFFKQEQTIALGEYSKDGFDLFVDKSNEVKNFANAMQAFSYLRSIFDPTTVSPKTMEILTTPARAVDNLSKYRDNNILSNLTVDAMFAQRK